jgi:hypothetical protein
MLYGLIRQAGCKTMNVTFRLRKRIKHQGMAFVAIFLAIMAALSSVFFLKDPAKHGFHGEHSVAVFGVFGLTVLGAMLLMSIYIWATYYVARFTINGTTLSIRSMFKNRQFDVSEVRRLTWRVDPMGGTIRFRLLGSKACLELYGYAKEDRLAIIRALRDLVPSHVHEGWPQFCNRVALSLRDGEPSVVRSEPSVQFCTITRSRYDRMFMYALPLSVALAVLVWFSLGLWDFFVLSVLLIAAWLVLRFHVLREGSRDVLLTSTLDGRIQLIMWSAMVSANLVIIALALSGAKRDAACGTGCVMLAAAVLAVSYLVLKSSKERRAKVARAEEIALAHWNVGELGSDPA